MQVKRETLVKALQFANLGTSARGETLEQSNSFIFKEGKLITFNDEILTISESPLDFTAAVLADDFVKLMEKFPDEYLEINLKGEEVIIKGKRRSAGITCFHEIQLPYDAVPAPSDWSKLSENTLKMLVLAAHTCGKDVTQALTMVVHTTPKLIEASDNFRLFRANLNTGFPGEVLLPALSVLKLDGLDIKRVSIAEGWAHFRTASKQVIALRCSQGKYHEGIDKLLDIGKADKVNLPKNLSEIVSRTIVMMDAEQEPRIKIKLAPDELTVESRKDSGWYREKKRVEYMGGEMEFEVSPKFLVEILQQTREVLVNESNRMKIETDGMQFIVALYKPEKKEDATE